MTALMDTPNADNTTQKQVAEFILDLLKSLGSVAVIGWGALRASRKWRAREEQVERKEASDLADVLVKGIDSDQARKDKRVDTLETRAEEARIREIGYLNQIAELQRKVAQLEFQLEALRQRLEAPKK